MKKLLISLLILLSSTLLAQTTLQEFHSYSTTDRSVILSVDDATIYITFYRNDIVKIAYAPAIASEFKKSEMVLQDSTETVSFTVSETQTDLTISSDEIDIVCTKNPFRISYFDKSGKLLIGDSKDENGGLGYQLADDLPNGLRFVAFETQDEERFYGSGARGNGLNLAESSFSIINAQHYAYTQPQESMNLNVPVLLSSNGYAIYFDNAGIADMDIGESNANMLAYILYAGELSYFIITGQTYQTQLEKYTWLTGRQPMPPKWSFGYIQSKYGYRNEAQARDMVSTMRSKNIPCDAIVLDLYWFRRMGDISWNPGAFGSPFSMMSDFLDDGIKTVVITEPYVEEGAQNFSEGDQNGYFVKNSEGNTYLLSDWWSCGCNAALVDFTNQDASDWWWSKHPAFFGDELAGIWTDLGEPERHEFPMVHEGGSVLDVHNIYNLLWAKSIFHGYNQFRPNQRLFNMTRSGYAGIQRYSTFTWSGDVGTNWDAFESQMDMMLNVGMSGLAYHHSDIGGFCCGNTSSELYIRWMQYGAFSGIMRAHGVDYQPQEPWGYDDETEAIVKKYIELRYQLLPYTYTMAHKNSETGIPIARPLFFEEPDTKFYRDLSSTYFWGDDIIVSPVTLGSQNRQGLYLPKGSWVDFHTDEVYEGGKYSMIDTPLDIMPIVVRAGAIIPMAPIMQYTDEFIMDTLYVHIYPSDESASSFTLYEDDGITLDYQNGMYSETTMEQWMSTNNDTQTLTVRINPTSGNYNGKILDRTYITAIHLIRTNPNAVLVNETTLTKYDSYTDLRNTINGFYFDQGNHILYASVRGATDSTYEFTIENASLTSVTDDLIAGEYELDQNYPNPFNASTMISYTIPNSGHVRITVYDMLGREVATLIDGVQSAGKHEIHFDGESLASGAYIYRITVGSFSAGKKMLLLK